MMNEVPLYGTYQTVKAIFWPWLSGEIPLNLFGCSLAQKRSWNASPIYFRLTLHRVAWALLQTEKEGSGNFTRYCGSFLRKGEVFAYVGNKGTGCTEWGKGEGRAQSRPQDGMTSPACVYVMVFRSLGPLQREAGSFCRVPAT